MDVVIKSGERLITLDNSRFTTLIVDPTIVKEEVKVHCLYCGHWLMSMNRKFAVAADGAEPFGGGDVPLNVFRVTRVCGVCLPKHYYIIYFNGTGPGL